MRSKLYYELIKRLILLILLILLIELKDCIKSLMEISLLNSNKYIAF